MTRRISNDFKRSQKFNEFKKAVKEHNEHIITHCRCCTENKKQVKLLEAKNAELSNKLDKIRGDLE